MIPYSIQNIILSVLIRFVAVAHIHSRSLLKLDREEGVIAIVIRIDKKKSVLQ